MRKYLKLSIIPMVLGLTGCLGQPDVKKIVSKGGNFKQVLQKDRRFTIVAENPKETLVSSGEYILGMSIDGDDVYSMFDDAKAYCDSIGGKSLVGDELKKIQRKYPDPTHFSTAKIVFAKETAPNVLFKCVSSKDGFSIIEKGLYQAVYSKNMFHRMSIELAYYYRYFLIKHDKNQKIGFKDKDFMVSKKYTIPNKKIDIAFATNSPVKSYEYVPYYGNLLCRNNDGKSYIKIKDKLFNFNDYIINKIKKDYKKSGWRDIQFLSIAPTKGIFYCKYPNGNFEIRWDLTTATFYPYIKDKVDFNNVSNISSNKSKNENITPISPQKINIKSNHHLKSFNNQLSNISIQKGIGYKVLATKKPFLLETGLTTYKGYYIGSYKNCDRSAVIVKSNVNSEIYNYAKCGSEFKDLGVTPPVAFDKVDLYNIKKITPILKQQCKFNGEFQMRYRNIDLICKYNNDTYQIFILQNGMLVSVENN